MYKRQHKKRAIFDFLNLTINIVKIIVTPTLVVENTDAHIILQSPIKHIAILNVQITISRLMHSLILKGLKL